METSLVMPGRLTRYLVARTVIGIGGVTLLLVGLYVGIDIVREAGDLQRDYGVPDMLLFVTRTVPTRLYDIFPFAALIGVLVGLGQLAAHRELVAMRAAGLDRAPDGVITRNPVFDVTPADFIDCIVTERGVLEPPFDGRIEAVVGSA